MMSNKNYQDLFRNASTIRNVLELYDLDPELAEDLRTLALHGRTGHVQRILDRYAPEVAEKIAQGRVFKLPKDSPLEGIHVGQSSDGGETGPPLFVPLKGVSMIAVEGQVFHDPAADEALFSALREHLDPKVETHWLELDINDERFALAMADRLHELYRDWRGS